MNRSPGGYIGCCLLLLVVLIFLPVIAVPLLLLFFFQALTGRRMVFMNTFRSAEPPPSEPEPDSNADENRDVPASEAVIDVEAVDLPDEPPPPPPTLSDSGESGDGKK